MEHPSGTTSCLNVPCLRPAAVQLPYRPRPGLVQMDGVISAANGRQQSARIAVVLDGSFRLRGWIQTKSESSEWNVGEVVDGSWSTSDAFTFDLCFSPKSCTGEGSSVATDDVVSRFKMIGDLNLETDTFGAQSAVLAGTCKCVSGTSSGTASFLGISINTPGTFSISSVRAPTIHPTSRGSSLLLTPRMPDTYGKMSDGRFCF